GRYLDILAMGGRGRVFDAPVWEGPGHRRLCPGHPATTICGSRASLTSLIHFRPPGPSATIDREHPCSRVATSPATTMRRPPLLLVALALVVGWGKKTPPSDANPGGSPDAPPDPGLERAELLAPLKTAKGDALRSAVESVAARAKTDPQLIGGLVELLKDPTNAGAGKTHPAQITSTPEAAAIPLPNARPPS